LAAWLIAACFGTLCSTFYNMMNKTMRSKTMAALSVFGVLLFSVAACADKPVIIDLAEAQENADFVVQGEYVGEVEDQRVGLQVAAQGGGGFAGMLYLGGLPGDGWMNEEGDRKVAVEGDRRGEQLLLQAEDGSVLSFEDGRFLLFRDDGEQLAELEKVGRESPTMGMEPPEGATVLFDGSDTEKWHEGTRMTEEGLLKEGATTADKYGDMRLHLEFQLGFMPGHRGQNRANSGVYIQRRYEVQVLDSFAMPAVNNGAASLYKEKAADLNMSFPPLTWQTYDIAFCAPKFDDDGNKTANARITVHHNGVLVHDDVELEQGTGAGARRGVTARDVLYLQDHGGDPVRFRNVWLVEECE